MIIHVLQDILKYYKLFLLNPTGLLQCGTWTVEVLIDVNRLQLPGCSDESLLSLHSIVYCVN